MTSSAVVPPLGPDSLVWQRLGDWRALLLGGRSLLLQVAHPTVAAGVSQFSNYREDPWGRLYGTLDLYIGVLFNGEEAAATGQRLRDLHKRIKGVDAEGRHYHALEPEAFHWVHATLVEGSVELLARFGRPLRGAELDRFYAEMCAAGQLYGLRERDMPPDWKSFRAYFDDFVATQLERNEVVDDVLWTVTHPPRPDRLPVTDNLWRVGVRPAARAMWLATIGTLPPVLREQWGLEWTRANETELRALGAAVRASFPLIPARIKLMPPVYAAQRRLRRQGYRAVAAARPA